MVNRTTHTPPGILVIMHEIRRLAQADIIMKDIFHNATSKDYDNAHRKHTHNKENTQTTVKFLQTRW